ncbi:DNA replication endonuclease-helicase Dna2 [Linderina pennispora]|nr:DNA replication endonuclease-helicase Dna2 [Linderina pennispora]
MNSDIQQLANRLVYDGHLRCGSLKVACQRIEYPVDPAEALAQWPFRQKKPSKGFSMPWVTEALDPKCGAVFLNTDAIPGLETRVEGSDLVQNNSEVNVIRILVNTLRACGIEGSQIGVLSPYRAQLKQIEIEFGIGMADEDEHQLLREPLGDVSEPSTLRIPGLDVHTIDRYQGRDADVIVISWVRSNGAQAIGDLLRDWHRINVAITRAKRKLLMVGSKSTLLRSPLFTEMLRILVEANAVVDIQAGQVFAEAQCLLDARARGKAKKAAVQTAGSAMLNRHPILKNLLAEQL